MTDDTIAVLRTMLAAAGLTASDDELAAYAAAYPDTQAGVEALYAVPAARYVDPALRFRAAARIENWA